MSAASDYLEGQIRAHLFRTASFTKPTVLAICLCTAAPNDASTGATIVEPPDGDGYDRQTLNPLDANWTAASATDGLTDNASAIVFGPCTGTNWGSITHFAICDSATYGAGNMLVYGPVATPRTIEVGDTFTFPIGDLDVIVA